MRAAPGALAGLLLAALSGCGPGMGPGGAGTDVLVTRDFGARTLSRRAIRRLGASESVMRLLERSSPVRTGSGGDSVESIDGLAGGQQAGRPVDWFYYVNGLEAMRGPATTRVKAGDRIWWDLHDRSVRVGAVVGSFPEPFLHGVSGKRIPVRIDCAADALAECDRVAARLEAAGVVASRAALGTPGGQDLTRVLVGTWSSVTGDSAAHQLEVGPAASGVYARFSRAGRRLELLDSGAGDVGALGAGSGLVAATRYPGQQATWVVTGTDRSGLDRAVDALDARTLAGHFAVAVGPTGVATVPVGAE